MKALTLLRPWHYCITHLGKRIENRTWRPPNNVIGRIIAIHAGKGIDAAGMTWLHREGLIKVPMPTEAHIAGAIVATAVVEGCVDSSTDKWFSGPVGWVLTDVVVFQPIFCRGALGLWTVPEHIALELA